MAKIKIKQRKTKFLLEVSKEELGTIMYGLILLTLESPKSPATYLAGILVRILEDYFEEGVD